jgi:hypothetical protein
MSRIKFLRLHALTRRCIAYFDWKRTVASEYKPAGSGRFAHGLDGELIYCPPVKKTNNTE